MMKVTNEMTSKQVSKMRKNECADIDVEARMLQSQGYKIMLDSREMFSAAFMDAEDVGLIEHDSLGFTWYPMSKEEIETRAHMMNTLAEIWIAV